MIKRCQRAPSRLRPPGTQAAHRTLTQAAHGGGGGEGGGGAAAADTDTEASNNMADAPNNRLKGDRLVWVWQQLCVVIVVCVVCIVCVVGGRGS